MSTEPVAAAAAPKRSKALHITLWVVQIFVALSFAFGGGIRTFAPIAMLASKIPWVPAVPEWVVRLSGGSEVLGAIGLILPSATRIKPWLTPLAAASLVLVMIL